MCCTNDKAVVGNVLEEALIKLNIEHCVVDFPVAQELFDVHDVLGVVVFHCGLPMSEGVEEHKKRGNSV